MKLWYPSGLALAAGATDRMSAAEGYEPSLADAHKAAQSLMQKWEGGNMSLPIESDNLRWHKSDNDTYDNVTITTGYVSELLR